MLFTLPTRLFISSKKGLASKDLVVLSTSLFLYCEMLCENLQELPYLHLPVFLKLKHTLGLTGPGLCKVLFGFTLLAL